MAAIECKMEIPKVEGLTDNEMTVGREALLACEGEFPKNIQTEKLHFVLAPEQKYALKLLKARFETPTKLYLKFTTYVAAEVQAPDLTITDDVEKINLGNITFKVTSVLPKPEATQEGTQPQKPLPFGPIGPIPLSVPMMYWLILFGFIGSFVLFFIFKFVRAMQRRNVIEKLKEHDSALSPVAQFHQNMRKLQRSNPAFFGGTVAKTDIQVATDELRQMFHLFITRKYQVPALEWGPRLILKDIKKYHSKVHQEVAVDLQALLKEYEHANANKDSVLASDVVNLAKRTRNLVEQMESLT